MARTPLEFAVTRHDHTPRIFLPSSVKEFTLRRFTKPHALRSAKERLIHTADTRLVAQLLASRTEDIAEKISQYNDHIQQPGTLEEEDKRQYIVQTLNTFQATYILPDGTPNRETLADLAITLLDRVDIITKHELLATAKKVVTDAPDTIVLYVPWEKAEEADFTSNRSQNSNEFMAKLVQRYAAKAGKSVTLVTDYEDLAMYSRIVIIDDAVYSGLQMSSRFSALERVVQHPMHLLLYVARATDTGIKLIANDISTNNNITFEPHVGQKLETLDQALANSPEGLTFFLASGMSTLLEDRDTINAIYRYATGYITWTALTISETKTPDFLSFPHVVAKGIQRSQADAGYPSINTLRFI